MATEPMFSALLRPDTDNEDASVPVDRESLDVWLRANGKPGDKFVYYSHEPDDTIKVVGVGEIDDQGEPVYRPGGFLT
jgi:hypothetical protein